MFQACSLLMSCFWLLLCGKCGCNAHSLCLAHSLSLTSLITKKILILMHHITGPVELEASTRKCSDMQCLRRKWTPARLP